MQGQYSTTEGAGKPYNSPFIHPLTVGHGRFRMSSAEYEFGKVLYLQNLRRTDDYRRTGAGHS